MEIRGNSCFISAYDIRAVEIHSLDTGNDDAYSWAQQLSRVLPDLSIEEMDDHVNCIEVPLTEKVINIVGNALDYANTRINELDEETVKVYFHSDDDTARKRARERIKAAKTPSNVIPFPLKK